jgi:organic radical activating enzyme
MTWCPFPFRNVMINADGTYSTCCYGEPLKGLSRDTHTVTEVFYSEQYETIRQNLKNGIRDNNCSKCWALEDVGTESLRLQEIRTEEFDTEVITDSPRVEQVFASLGNQCNLKCRTCSPAESSLWVKEYNDTEGTFIKINQESENSRFYENFSKDVIPNLKEIVFTGGEPFLLKSTKRILEILNLDTSITIHTNGTISKPELLNKFTDVNIVASIDGVGSRFEYMRHPGKWNQVYNNLKEYGSQLTAITCTVSAYNIWYLDEVEQLASSLGIDFYAHILYTPPYLSVHVLPLEVRQIVIDKLSHSKSEQIQKIASHLKEDTYNDWQAFVQEVKKRDLYRNESFKDTFPEYYQVLNQYDKEI